MFIKRHVSAGPVSAHIRAKNTGKGNIKGCFTGWVLFRPIVCIFFVLTRCTESRARLTIVQRPGSALLMKKKATRITGIRFSEATYKAVVHAAKVRDFASPSAFMRAAVEKELRGAEAILDESEQRINASLEKYSKQVRRVSTGQQALFAYVDTLAKVILSTLPDTDEDTRNAAVARGKLRYSRFLKSVGANMVGDAQAALSELVNRAPEE